MCGFFTVNCLDRHVINDPSAVAIIWEKNEPGEQEEVSYKYVRLIVNTVATVSDCLLVNEWSSDGRHKYAFCLILGNFLSRPVR